MRVSAGTHGGQTSVNRIAQITLGGDEDATGYDFGELGMRAEYIGVKLHLASTPAQQEALREIVARGEELAGNGELAQRIRHKVTQLPGSELQ